MTTTLLNLLHSILAYDGSEGSTNNNPNRRLANWTREFRNVQVENAVSNQAVIQPGGSLAIYSGTQATSIDGTTAFAVSLLAGTASTYRFLSAAGTAPAFRAERALAAGATTPIVVTTNNNSTAKFASSGTGALSFAAVQIGDVLRIAGLSTGDAAGPFNTLNEGYWSVIGKDATSITCVRPDGAAFLAAAESVVLGLGYASVFRAYSAAGVQVGSTVDVSAGFSAVTQKSYTVTAVAPDFFEVVSTTPIPLESGIMPDASGMVFYTSAKKVVYVEVDQEAVVRLNGDASNSNRLSPFLPGDPAQVAVFHKVGLAYSLTVVNRSTKDPMNVYWFLAQ